MFELKNKNIAEKELIIAMIDLGDYFSPMVLKYLNFYIRTHVLTGTVRARSKFIDLELRLGAIIIIISILRYKTLIACE